MRNRLKPRFDSNRIAGWRRAAARRAALSASALGLAGLLLMPSVARAGAPAAAPQVLLAITNSESMDGTVSGAIMVGSGSLAATYGSLTSSSSPVNYPIPNGFVPPLNPGAGGFAPYTTACGANLCDNGPSRLNMAKAAMQQALTAYGASLNFGLYTYQTGAPALYTTWVYAMSGPGGFGFTNTASAGTMANPCFGYPSATANVQTYCGSIAGLYGAAALANNAYVANVAATSDNAQINDVLYWGGGTSEFVTYGTVTPANPYAYYSLANYNSGNYWVGYGSVTSGGITTTGPTNAGYVPYSPQVWYSMRGFGYGSSQSAITGSLAVAMGTDPTGSNAFTTALAPESNNAGTHEIKSVAGQSAIGGLLKGAKTYLGGLAKAQCQAQYVVLLTDGLPTMDLNGSAWPPLGTATANAYGLTATYNADGSFKSSNSQAVTDAMGAIAALAGAGIKTYIIGLGAGVDPHVNPSAAQLLQAMAIAGGTTNYFAATDSGSLNNAFLTIANQIYTASAATAPIAPISVAGGSSYEYSLTSIPVPQAGHVSAYAVNAAGLAAANPSWDAAALMTTAGRTGALMAPNSAGTAVTLANVDAAAFNLTPTACVPNVATIVSYTIDPSYVYNGCSYLAGRQSGWLLGKFSTRDTGMYVAPPSSSLLTVRYPTYAAYALASAARTPMLLFSNSDGFIYAVNASSGALLWGWTSRPILAGLQSYSTFAASGATNGGFTVVDAPNAGGTWGSYLVGSLQSGAEHFSVALNGAGTPQSVVYDSLVAGGTSAGDTAVATGSGPSRQPVVIAYTSSGVYAVYVVSVGNVSTLYEVNVATGASTSAALGFKVSSALYLNPVSLQLWLGGADGTVRVISSITGNAAWDQNAMATIGSMVDPTTGLAVKPVLNVGYSEINGAPYVYALSAGQLSVFGIGGSGWMPLWAATTAANYKYSGGAWAVNAGGTTLIANSVASDAPVTIQGSTLLVPEFVAGSDCSAGTGYYVFFDLRTGAVPTSIPLTYNGVAVGGPISVGAGAALTPSITLTSGGMSLNPGATGVLHPQTPLLSNGSLTASAFSWRQR